MKMKYRSKLEEAYERVVAVEDDIKEAIRIAIDLKKGLLFQSLSNDEMTKKLNKIIEVLEK